MNKLGRGLRWVALAVLPLCGCISFVPAGHVGVKWTPGGLDPTVYREGAYAIAPWNDMTEYDARSQEHEEQLEVLAVNGLRINLIASVRYHMIGDDAVALHRELGPEYYSILLGPTLRSQARRVVGRYTPEEIYSTQRELIERQIRQGVDTALAGRHVELEAVLIRDVQLPPEIQRAINDKLEAEQRSLKEKFLIEQARQEEERAKIQAEGQAESTRIGALAAADAQRIAAKGADDANKLIEQHVNERVLKWRQLGAIDRLASSGNSKVVLLPEGKALPLLQVQ